MTVVDEVKSRLDIVEIISTYVTLNRSGQRYKAPCPFHQEKTPSFVVYPDRQSWHCFGACASGGDVFSFVMRAESLDFAETLKRLSQQAGVALPTSQRHTRENLAYQINEAAKSFYQGILASDQGVSTRSYLEKRGLTGDSLARFELGLSPPDGESLGNYLTKTGFSLEQLTEAGVVRVNDRGQSRDLFRGRLIIPIRNSRGELGGFGSRTLDDSGPKYLNSARTAVFDKGRILYGLHLAQEAARQQGLVVVEGYMDVIMAHQHGFTNVVASMGTALTRDQVAEVRRLTGKVVMALDPDAAGQQATLRSLATSWEVFQKLVTERDRKQQNGETIIFQRQEDLELKIMSLPDNLDPDELIRRSPQEWAGLVEGAVPLFEYLLPAVSQQLDISTSRGKTRVAELLFPFIAAVPEPIQQDLYFQQLAAYIGVDQGTLKASTGRLAAGRVSSHSGRSSTGTARRPNPDDTEMKSTASSFASLERDPIEEYCLALALQHPNLVPETALVPEHFRRPENRELAGQLLQLTQNPPGDIGSPGNTGPPGDIGSDAATGQKLKQIVAPALQEQLELLIEKELPPVEARNRLRVLQSAVRRLEDRFLRELKIEEAIWFSEEQPDILEEPNPNILDVNQRIRGNESNRSWLDRKTLSGR